MTDHQEQQAGEANTDKSPTISLALVGQTHSNRPTTRYSKTSGKTNTYVTHTPNEELKNTQHVSHTCNTLHKSVTTNNGDDISQANKELNNGKRSLLIRCHLTKMFRRIVRGMTLTSEYDMEG